MPDTPRYEIVRGGTPTDEQLAALTVALTPVAPGPADAPTRPPAPAWARAAVLEHTGGRAAVSPADLAGLERTAGRI